jgi:hypothetical protein
VVFRTHAGARAPIDLSRIRRRRDDLASPTSSTRKHFMLRTPSFLGPLNSGFVPDTPAAPIDALADDAIAAEAAAAEAEAAKVVARAAAAPLVDQPLHEPIAPWQPASSARIRFVEGAVLAAVCGYFAWGLLRTLTGF